MMMLRVRLDVSHAAATSRNKDDYSDSLTCIASQNRPGPISV